MCLYSLAIVECFESLSVFVCDRSTVVSGRTSHSICHRKPLHKSRTSIKITRKCCNWRTLVGLARRHHHSDPAFLVSLSSVLLFCLFACSITLFTSPALPVPPLNASYPHMLQEYRLHRMTNTRGWADFTEWRMYSWTRLTLPSPSQVYVSQLLLCPVARFHAILHSFQLHLS